MLKLALIRTIPSPLCCPSSPTHLTEGYLVQLRLLSRLHHLLQIGGHHNDQQVDANEGTNGDEDGKVDGTPDLHNILSPLHPGDGRQWPRHLSGPLSLSFLIYEMRKLSLGTYFIINYYWDFCCLPAVIQI